MMDNYKKCTHCHEIKHTDDYYKDKRGKYGVESLCRDCRRAKTDVQATINRGIVAAAKYKPCHCCGKVLHPSLIDLHHLDPKSKEITVSKGIYHRSAASLMREIEKCVPVCRPCHREIHHGN
jgi:hypothetical protein